MSMLKVKLKKKISMTLEIFSLHLRGVKEPDTTVSNAKQVLCSVAHNDYESLYKSNLAFIALHIVLS